MHELRSLNATKQSKHARKYTRAAEKKKRKEKESLSTIESTRDEKEDSGR